MFEKLKFDKLLLELGGLAPKGYFVGLHIRFTSPLLTFQTYDQAWTDHYTDHGYVLRDPMTAWGFSTTGSIRRTVHARLISELARASRLLGATHCLTLLAANWPRWAGRVGVDMTAMGPVLEIDGIDNQLVSMDFSSNLH